MKHTTIALITAGMLILIGCESKSPLGGPGADNSSKIGTPDNAFQVSVGSVTIKQGETRTIPISITRGTDFDQDVALAVSDHPTGLTLKFDEPMIRPSANKSHLTIDASKDASLGNHSIKVMAMPAKSGPATSVEIKIAVNKP